MVAKTSIPNLLTFARLLAAPATLLLIIIGAPPLATLILFLAASVTDFFDGYLARKWQCVSAFGAFADPIADKLLVTVILIQFAAGAPSFLLPVTLILMREIYISGLREYLAGRGIPLPVSSAGKLKTALQMLAIVITLIALVIHHQGLAQLGLITLWLATVVTITSAVSYTRAAFRGK